MPIQINELRLSFVWNTSFAKDVLMPYLSDSDRYKREFDQAKDGTGTWSLPWQIGEPQHFWEYYTNVSETGGLAAVNADRAWEYLIPLRAPMRARITSPDGVQIRMEGFCFPHSVGVVATAFMRYEPPLPLDSMVDKAVEVSRADCGLKWSDEAPETHGTLQGLAAGLMDRLHQSVLASAIERGKPLSAPLTIATVIDATGVWQAGDQTAAVVKKAMDGLCLLHPGWRQDSQTTTDDSAPSKNVLHPRDRGRAIWLPNHFTEVPGNANRRLRKLGYYHRSLTLAALQARSLTHLVRRAADFLPNEPVSPLIAGPTRWAIGILNDLYSGAFETYRSWSLQYQVNYYLDTIAQVYQVLGNP